MADFSLPLRYDAELNCPQERPLPASGVGLARQVPDGTDNIPGPMTMTGSRLTPVGFLCRRAPTLLPAPCAAGHDLGPVSLLGAASFTGTGWQLFPRTVRLRQGCFVRPPVALEGASGGPDYGAATVSF